MTLEKRDNSPGKYSASFDFFVREAEAELHAPATEMEALHFSVLHQLGAGLVTGLPLPADTKLIAMSSNLNRNIQFTPIADPSAFNTVKMWEYPLDDLKKSGFTRSPKFWDQVAEDGLVTGRVYVERGPEIKTDVPLPSAHLRILKDGTWQLIFIPPSKAILKYPDFLHGLDTFTLPEVPAFLKKGAEKYFKYCRHEGIEIFSDMKPAHDVYKLRQTRLAVQFYPHDDQTMEIIEVQV